MSDRGARCRWRWLASVPLVFVSCTESRWPNVPFGEVRAYMFNLAEGIERDGKLHNSIIVDGKLDSTVVIPDGIQLSGVQVERLVEAIDSTAPSEWSAACFNPRHAFVFYDDQHRPVAWLNICFECHSARAEPKPPRAIDVCQLRDLCWQLRLPVLDTSGGYLEALQQLLPELVAPDR